MTAKQPNASTFNQRLTCPHPDIHPARRGVLMESGTIYNIIRNTSSIYLSGQGEPRGSAALTISHELVRRCCSRGMQLCRKQANPPPPNPPSCKEPSTWNLDLMEGKQ